jgi:hypothetical protein
MPSPLMNGSASRRMPNGPPGSITVSNALASGPASPSQAPALKLVNIALTGNRLSGLQAAPLSRKNTLGPVHTTWNQ